MRDENFRTRQEAAEAASRNRRLRGTSQRRQGTDRKGMHEGFCLNLGGGGAPYLLVSCGRMRRHRQQAGGRLRVSPICPQGTGWPSHLLSVRTGKSWEGGNSHCSGKGTGWPLRVPSHPARGLQTGFEQVPGARSSAGAEAHWSAALGSGVAGRGGIERARTQGLLDVVRWGDSFSEGAGAGGEGEGGLRGRECVIGLDSEALGVLRQSDSWGELSQQPYPPALPGVKA